MTRRFACAVLSALALTLATGGALAQQVVDLELVLLADATGSIDDAEIRFQRRGYADAISHPDVLAAISGGLHQSIAVAYVEWGDASAQDVVVPWTLISSSEDAGRFAVALNSAPRRAFGRNAIGSALAKALDLIEGNDITGLRRVIDLSGDSANNWNGPAIETVRRQIIAKGITINGLAILCRELACSGRPVDYDLEKAFETEIIGGPRGFVVTADGPGSFTAAVRRKLILEISQRGTPTHQAGRPHTLIE